MGSYTRSSSNNASNRQVGLQFPRTINVDGSPGLAAPSNLQVDGIGTGSSLGFRLGSVSEIFNLDLRLQYAEIENLARIVSRPSITVLDNRKARIIQGTKIPFITSSSDGTNVQFQEAGIEIGVTPQITSDGSVALKVETKSNEAGGVPNGGNTSILIREATTEMLVKSGRTAVLGGVFRTSDKEGTSGVPLLKDIPILGYLFKGTSKGTEREETLIFITPYILSDVRTAASAPTGASELEP